MAAPIELELTIQKQIGIWITIPCINETLGSCTFKDICAELPAPFCPLAAGPVKLNLQVPLPSVQLPAARSRTSVPNCQPPSVPWQLDPSNSICRCLCHLCNCQLKWPETTNCMLWHTTVEPRLPVLTLICPSLNTRDWSRQLLAPFQPDVFWSLSGKDSGTDTVLVT